MTMPFPDPESLLQHREFLRALAQQLLHDEHLAEDVVQESFVAALTRPPRDEGALRSWLAQVVTRGAANHRRSAVRRAARERESAADELQPSAVEVSESLRVQRVLLERLNDLDEPYRTAIFLRWYEGLPPREVARRTGAPVETVRSRVRRGLERLRKGLDDEEGGREAWAVALAPLCRPPRPAVAAVVPIAVGMVALSLVSLLGWRLRPDGVMPRALQPANTIREVRSGLSASADEPLGAILTQPRSELGTTGTAAPGTSASVAASAGDGLPEVDGLHYELDLDLPADVTPTSLFVDLVFLGEPDAASGERATTVVETRPVERSLTTFVRFAPPPPPSLVGIGGRSSHALRIRDRDGHLGGYARVHAVAGRYPVPVRAKVEACAALQVQLHDELGEPFDGVHAALELDGGSGFMLDGVTDASGALALPLLPEGRARLRIRSAETAELTRVVELVNGQTATVDLSLLRRRGFHVAGRVHGRSGDGFIPGPLRLRRIDETSPPWVVEAQPQPLDGAPAGGGLRFDFGDVPEGRYLLLPPVDSAFRWDPPLLRVNSGTDDLRLLRLDGSPTRRVRLRVRDEATGEPLDGCRSVILVERYELDLRATAELDAGGVAHAFDFDESPWPAIDSRLPVHWLIEREGYLAAQGDESAFLWDAGAWRLDVDLRPSWKAALWVGTRDATGAAIPVPDAKLVTTKGRELGRTLGDGLLYLDLAYDPGRVRVEYEGWRVKEWTGFRRGRPIEERELYEVWLEPLE